MREETPLQTWVSELDATAIAQTCFPHTSHPTHYHCPKMFLYQIAADPGTPWPLERLEPNESKRKKLACWYAEARHICTKLGYITTVKDTDILGLNVERLKVFEVSHE